MQGTHSGLAILRKMCKPEVHLSQEFLSLTENKQFRSSQQRKARERYRKPYAKITHKKRMHKPA
jgi:hypothetical protein